MGDDEEGVEMGERPLIDALDQALRGAEDASVGSLDEDRDTLAGLHGTAYAVGKPDALSSSGVSSSTPASPCARAAASRFSSAFMALASRSSFSSSR